MMQKEASPPSTTKDLVISSANDFLDSLDANLGFLDETEWKYIERSILSIIKTKNEGKYIAETAKMMRDCVRNCFASWTARENKFKCEEIHSIHTIAITAIRKAISRLITWVDTLNDQEVKDVLSSLQNKINKVLTMVRDERMKKTTTARPAPGDSARAGLARWAETSRRAR